MKKYLYSISYYVTNERAEIAGLQNMNFYSNKNTIDAIYQDALKEISKKQVYIRPDRTKDLHGKRYLEHIKPEVIAVKAMGEVKSI